MDLDSDVRPENLDSKLVSSSPSTQSDISTDGDASLTHPNNLITNEKPSTPTESFNSSSIEPKAKKRRKQSKPLKCQNIPSADIEMPLDEMEVDKVDDQVLETKEHIPENLPEEVKIKDGSEENSAESEKATISDTSSQKNILLSHMTELFNNKFRDTDLINQMANRSKGQVLSDVNSPDSNEEMQRNLDPKTIFPGFYPQMPPLLPINPNELVGELSKLTKLSSVFSHLADLTPAPYAQAGTTAISGSNRSFVTSSGVRVFNPEAYCELCEKEFCNKYFLKTHKANKHGVCSTDSPTSTLFRAPFKSTAFVPSIPSLAISQTTENGSQGSSDAYCNICQKSFCNKYFLKKHRLNIHGIIENGTEPTTTTPSSIHVPVISTLLLNRMPGVDTKSDNSLDYSGNDEQKYVNMSLANIKNSMNGNPMTALLNFNGFNAASLNNVKNFTANKSERFLCELCNIEFCDKHYLDSHRQNKHQGETSPSDTQEYGNYSSEVSKTDGTEKNKGKEDVGEFKEQTCAPCMKKFTSSEAFQSHMFDVHGAAIRRADEEEDSNVKLNSLNNDLKSNINASGSPPFVKKPTNLPDSENSNNSADSGFVFCSLCLMKFKDKNSLLVHIDSHHSLNDSYSQGNGVNNFKEFTSSQISDFQCDVCPERFADKNVLLTHRLKLHGIISPISESSIIDNEIMKGIEAGLLYTIPDKLKINVQQSFCRICNKEISNKSFLKTHMLKMHAIDVDKLIADRSAITGSGVACDICDKILANKHCLKIHKLSAHNINEEASKQVSTPSEPFKETLNNKTTEQCTSKPSNAIQINRSVNPAYTKTNSIKETTDTVSNHIFSCEICGQEFPSKLTLQVHLVNKHVNNNESQITNLGELIGLSVGNPEILGLSPNSVPRQNGNSKDHTLNETLCSCCSFIKVDDSKLQGKPSGRMNGKILMCHLCSISYHINDYSQHHLTHQDIIPTEAKLKLKYSYDALYHNNVPNNKDVEFGSKTKQKPRKIKRFRCSKCSKPFRTRNKCLHHIQVIHKNKKGATSPHDKHPADPSPKKSNNNFVSKVEPKEDSDVEALNSEFSKPCSKDTGKKNSFDSKECQQSAPMPVPYLLPKNASDVIMQPFHLTEPKSEGMSKPDVFVPSLVYLPVSQKVSEPITVAFTLTPA